MNKATSVPPVAHTVDELSAECLGDLNAIIHNSTEPNDDWPLVCLMRVVNYVTSAKDVLDIQERGEWVMHYLFQHTLANGSALRDFKQRHGIGKAVE